MMFLSTDSEYPPKHDFFSMEGKFPPPLELKALIFLDAWALEVQIDMR